MRSVVNWSEYFLRIAQTVAIRSKDPSTQVGAILVDENRHIIGTGYNGMPPGYPETEHSWEKPLKYQNVIHAEGNCIIHATKSTKGASIYITHSPCRECSKLIVTSGIKNVVFGIKRDDWQASADFLTVCGVGSRHIDLDKTETTC